jgi:mRNA-degrading endonuclease YafQ of YafQ-DinJ toxin-antitoxin module
VARKQTFLAARFSERFEQSYSRLRLEQQKGVDELILALIKRAPNPGHRVKPILPSKQYFEARINSGDRLIFRHEESEILFVDVVVHDEIGKYGRRS